MSPARRPSVLVLGGGLSGLATAYTLARAGYDRVSLVEAGPALGGLAGSFEAGGHVYPLGYHHILHRDRTLLFFLSEIAALERVRWRRVRMLFRVGGQLYDLGTPRDFLRFPMALLDKARFARLMLRAFGKSDWSDWLDRSALDLVDGWGGPGVREAIFEPLTRLKFDLPCAEVSGAWLGARLNHREGSAPLGFLPGTNWTAVLCEGMARLVEQSGVRVLLRAPVRSLRTRGGRVEEAELADGTRLEAELFVSTVPTEVYRTLVPAEQTPEIASIRFTALLSAVCATRQPLPADFYWMNLASLDRAASGLFALSSLNPGIGAPGETCLNFVTHLQDRRRPFFQAPDEAVWAAYVDDFRAIFGLPLETTWRHLGRVPMYSPIFLRGYRNPPVRSTTWGNVYFGGNYRTFPSVASTGTALASGLATAEAVLGDHGGTSDLPGRAAAFRLRRMRGA